VGESFVFVREISEPPSGSPPARTSLLRETVETILLASIVFLVVNAATGRFSLDGPSMLPTLHKGEFVIVSRVEYRLHPPERGDVIVFQRPEGMRIKRIIGLPGETLEIRQGQVFIDGQFLPETYVKDPALYTMGPRTMGPDEYFVMGDNRSNSSDSHNYGPIEFNTIDGKAWLIYWPPQDWEFVPHYSYPTVDVYAKAK
jgi:signal peptidase I